MGAATAPVRAPIQTNSLDTQTAALRDGALPRADAAPSSEKQDVASLLNSLRANPGQEAALKDLTGRGEAAAHQIAQKILAPTTNLEEAKFLVGLLAQFDSQIAIKELHRVANNPGIPDAIGAETIQSLVDLNGGKFDGKGEAALQRVIKSDKASGNTRLLAERAVAQKIGEPTAATISAFEQTALNNAAAPDLRSECLIQAAQASALGKASSPEIASRLCQVAEKFMQDSPQHADDGVKAFALLASKKEAEGFLDSIKGLDKRPGGLTGICINSAADALSIAAERGVITVQDEKNTLAVLMDKVKNDRSMTLAVAREMLKIDPDRSFATAQNIALDPKAADDLRASAIDLMRVNIANATPPMQLDGKTIAALGELLKPENKSPHVAESLALLASETKSAYLIKRLVEASPQLKSDSLDSLNLTVKYQAATLDPQWRSAESAKLLSHALVESAPDPKLMHLAALLDPAHTVGKIFEYQSMYPDQHFTCLEALSGIDDPRVNKLFAFPENSQTDYAFQHFSKISCPEGRAAALDALKNNATGNYNVEWCLDHLSSDASPAILDAVRKFAAADAISSEKQSCRGFLALHGDSDAITAVLNDPGDVETRAKLFAAPTPAPETAKFITDHLFGADSSNQLRESIGMALDEPEQITALSAALKTQALLEQDEKRRSEITAYANALEKAHSFGIDHPFRYGPELLTDIITAREQGPTLAPGETRLAVCVVAKADHTDEGHQAMYQLAALSQLREKGYRVMLYEVDTDFAAAEQPDGFSMERAIKDATRDKVTNKSVQADLLFIAGHGTANSIDLGAAEDSNARGVGFTPQTFDLGDETKFKAAGLTEALKKDGTVATISCSVGWNYGAGSNIINMLRREFPQARTGNIMGAAASTNFGGFNFDSDGRVKSVKYDTPGYFADARTAENSEISFTA